MIHDVEGSRRDEISAAVASRAAHRHSRRLAGGARGRRRGLAVVHLSHAAAHHLDRLAQERLGRRRRRRSAGAGASRASGCGSSTSAATRRPTSRSRRSSPTDRTILAGAPVGLGGRDPQRLAAHARQRQGDPPRRRQADRGGAAGDRASSDGAGAALGPVPRLGAARALASSFRTTSCRATTRAGLPSRSKTRS